MGEVSGDSYARREGTSLTLVKAMVELDRLGTPTDDSGRQAVEALLVHLVQLRDMDSPNARFWAVDIFARLANHEVLTELTGSTEEWKEIPEHQRAGKYNYQNQRETSVMAQCEWVPADPEEVEGHGRTERLHVIEAIDVNALIVKREGAEDSGGAYATWMPIVFPYMPQRYHVVIDKDDKREDVEIEDEARQQFAGQQVRVTGGRTA